VVMGPGAEAGTTAESVARFARQAGNGLARQPIAWQHFTLNQLPQAESR
jgi:hypothetical protein